MTGREFAAWLEGYLTDRDEPNIDLIREKAQTIVSENQWVTQPFVPTITPTWPQFPGTGDSPTWPLTEITWFQG